MFYCRAIKYSLSSDYKPNPPSATSVVPNSSNTFNRHVLFYSVPAHMLTLNKVLNQASIYKGRAACANVSLYRANVQIFHKTQPLGTGSVVTAKN